MTFDSIRLNQVNSSTILAITLSNNTIEMKNNKVWFITGASKGLGLTLAKRLLAAGHKVAATSRNTATLINAVENSSDSFLPLKVELGNDESVAAAIAQTQKMFGRIDVVVNNAGYGIAGTIEELTDQETHDSFDINVFGTINVIRHALPIMRNQASGHVINISSIAGIAPTTGWSIYGAAKHAIIGLSEALMEDVKPFGIKVTVIAPGQFRTNFLSADSLVRSEKKIEAYDSIRELHSKYAGTSGQQLGDPEKAAKVMVEITEMPKPPLYLLLGSDAFTRAFNKLDLLASSYRQWETITRSTDF